MSGFDEKFRGRLDSRIPKPLPDAPPHDIHHQLPNHSGNEELSDEEVKEEAAKQQGEQSDGSPFNDEGLSMITHTGIVPPGSDGESQHNTGEDQQK